MARMARTARRTLGVTLLAITLASCGGRAEPDRREPFADGDVRLVVILVVDMVHADRFVEALERFADDGLARFVREGAYYPNARYPYANLLTAAGHATIATGRNPDEHGVVGNSWIDRTTGRAMYSTVTRDAPRPDMLRVETVGDAWVSATDGRARVFAVSGKDRAAVFLAGKRGTAWWYDTATGGFTSNSARYFPDGSPAWAAAWDGSDRARSIARYADATWTPALPLEAYRAYCDPESDGCVPPTAFASDGFELGDDGLTAFPVRLAEMTDLPRTARYTPYLDRLTVAFVEDLLAHEKLGEHGTDILGIGLSGTDYIGHAFGPDGIEYEDALLRLDETVGALLRAIDREVGLDRTLVALTSDHGVQGIPEHRVAAGLEGGRIVCDDLERAAAPVLARHGLATRDVLGCVIPSLYLDVAAIRAAGVDPGTVRRELASALAELDGIAETYAWSSDGPIRTGSAPTEFDAAVAASFDAERSGDVLLVPKRHWIATRRRESTAAMHGLPHAEDQRVPVAVWGPGVSAGSVESEVSPAGIAPTIAARLGFDYPGEPLPEPPPR